MSAPKRNPAPLGDTPHPLISVEERMMNGNPRTGERGEKPHRQDRTRGDHTLGRRGGLLVSGLWRGSGSWKVKWIYQPDGKTHLIDDLQVWAESTVNAEYSPIHDCTQGQIIKDLTTPSPNVGTRVLSLTFVVKAIDLSDLARLVISTDECNALGVTNFEGEKEEEGLYRVETSIDKVT